MLTHAITRLARVTIHVNPGGSPTRVHCIVSICVSLRFNHAQFASAFVRHLFHAQRHPSSTFIWLSGYDTSRPMARALSPYNLRGSEDFSVVQPVPTVCAEFDEHCLKTKCNALRNQIKQRSIAACVLRFIRVHLRHPWSTLRFNSAEQDLQQSDAANTINEQSKECDSSTR